MKVAMQFPTVSMHSIKSSNQRALAAHWNATAADRRFPSFTEFRPQPTDHSPEQTILWDVERVGDDGAYRFRVRQLGLRAAEALGQGLVGKTMDEAVPPALREVSLEGARECAVSGCAVYAIITTIANGHQVDCERLLLPFGGSDGVVEQIVASLQLISYQGVVERQEIARDFETRSFVSLSGKIGSDATMRRVADGFESPEPVRAHEIAAAKPPSHAQAAPPAIEDKQPPAESKKTPRRTVLKTGRIRYGKSSEICTVRDMSATGASLELAGANSVPDRFTLVLEMEAAARKCAVVWRKERQLGVQFG